MAAPREAVTVKGSPGTSLRLDVDGHAVATGQAHRIVVGHLPVWLNLFLEKNRKYAGLDGNALGAKGKFVDLYRKCMVLKSRMWDGHDVVGEDNREVILDMIGHLFLMLDDMDQENLRAVAEKPKLGVSVSELRTPKLGPLSTGCLACEGRGCRLCN